MTFVQSLALHHLLISAVFIVGDCSISYFKGYSLSAYLNVIIDEAVHASIASLLWSSIIFESVEEYSLPISTVLRPSLCHIMIQHLKDKCHGFLLREYVGALLLILTIFLVRCPFYYMMLRI